MSVTEEKLDCWRTYAGPMRVDILAVRQLLSRGEGTAAAQVLGGVLDSTLIAGVMRDDAGANRLCTMHPRPTGGALAEAEWEANE